MYREKMEKIDQFAKYRRLPMTLQKRMKSYYQYLYARQKGNDEQELLDDLPHNLRTDICLYINKEIVEKVPFFKDCDRNCLKAIITQLKPIVSSPGEYIIQEGDLGKEMYFISGGSVEIIVKGKTVAILKDGSFFGEGALLLSEKRNASVRALTYVDLYVLTKEVLDEVQEEFPGFKEMIHKTTLARIASNKNTATNDQNGTKKAQENSEDKRQLSILEHLKAQESLKEAMEERNKEGGREEEEGDTIASTKKLVSTGLDAMQSSIKDLTGSTLVNTLFQTKNIQNVVNIFRNSISGEDQQENPALSPTTPPPPEPILPDKTIVMEEGKEESPVVESKEEGKKESEGVSIMKRLKSKAFVQKLKTFATLQQTIQEENENEEEEHKKEEEKLKKEREEKEEKLKKEKAEKPNEKEEKIEERKEKVKEEKVKERKEKVEGEKVKEEKEKVKEEKVKEEKVKEEKVKEEKVESVSQKIRAFNNLQAN